MYHHLLVPLDGSRLAESALGPAVQLATAMSARITLLHVIENRPPDEIHGEPHLNSLDSAYRYLSATAAALPKGLQVDQHVHPNKEQDVARSIVEHAREFHVDLIVLCTHGHGSLRRWLFGTIAQKVIALGRIPVLVTHPSASPGQGAQCRRILVPLDGNPEHEVSVAVALDLARACSSQIHIVMVIPTLNTLPMESAATARLLPATTRAALDMTQETATAYLAAQLRVINDLGIEATGAVRRGDPVSLITQEAQQSGADYLVMATHGKSHMDAFWEGSVAPAVTGRTHLPLILAPVGAAHSGG